MDLFKKKGKKSGEDGSLYFLWKDLERLLRRSFLGPPVGKILFFFPEYHTVDLLFNRNPFKRPKYISLLKSMFMITARDSYQNYSITAD